MQLTPDQERAYNAARQVIDRQRARDIQRLKNWQHGMCGCLNADKPDVPEVTAEEDASVRALWDTLSGDSSWMSALYLLIQ